MAKSDRCTVCDYSELMGSYVGNALPGQNGKVRKTGDDYLCDVCVGDISSTYAELVQGQEEEKDGELDTSPPALPVREVV